MFLYVNNSIVDVIKQSMCRLVIDTLTFHHLSIFLSLVSIGRFNKKKMDFWIGKMYMKIFVIMLITFIVIFMAMNLYAKIPSDKTTVNSLTENASVVSPLYAGPLCAYNSHYKSNGINGHTLCENYTRDTLDPDHWAASLKSDYSPINDTS